MLFALGYIAGVVTCGFIAVGLLFFKKPLERFTDPLVTAIENAGPRPRGFLLEPDDDAQVARAEHIRRNAERGVDTPIAELM